MDKAGALNSDFFRQRFTSPKFSIDRRAILAGASIAAGAGVLLGVRFVPRFLSHTLATAKGETRVATLDDGSVITLNTATRVAVKFGRGQRDITLESGEAFFDVAPNAATPFQVNFAGLQAITPGGSFSIRNLAETPRELLVRDGRATLSGVRSPSGATVALQKNNCCTVFSDLEVAIEALSPSEIERKLLWRIGRIEFEGQTLAEAAKAFSRYSDIQIVIPDPRIQTRRITGLFVANDPVGFAKAVAVSLDLRPVVGGGEVRLLAL
jgi:transmembrane sensor